MLKLHTSQLAAFGSLVEAKFESDVVACLRKLTPAVAASYNDDELRARARLWINQANACGIQTDLGRAQYVALCLLLREHEAVIHGIGEILQTVRNDADETIDLLWEGLAE